MIFQKRFSDFKNYLLLNKSSALVIFIIYSVVNINIGLAEYPYIDDIGRQLQGYSKFSEHYSRYLSEYSARLIQGGDHLTELGLTSNILSACFLTLASLILLFVLYPNKKISFITASVSTIIGINPWFLEPLSFRFDNPFMTLSILVSIIPFIFWDNKKIFGVMSVVGIFLMCNSYQASSGVYIIVTMTLVFLELLQGSCFKEKIPKIFISMLSYVIGLLLYRIQIFIKPPIFADQADIPKGLEMIKIIGVNAAGYLNNIFFQSSTIWVLLTIIAIFLLTISVIRLSSTKFLLNFIYMLIWLSLGSVFSYGTYLILSNPYYLMRPRYEYGFGIFLAIILIVSLECVEKSKILRRGKSFVSGLLVFYFLSFSFTYVSSLKQQNEMFKAQSILLASSLNKYITPEKTVINVNRFLSDSPVFSNTASVYPMLKSLIMPNTNVSWDMTLRFNSITNLNVDFKLIDIANIDFSSENYTLLEETKLYNIYLENNELFVIMK